jgi:hypothetical protein
MEHLRHLSREELCTLVEIHAKSWLAHDGCWFLAAEEAYGMDAAVALDTRACELFSPVEARRIMKAFGIPEHGGLDALEKALRYRLYATVNPQVIERPDPNTLVFKMLDCRVQNARRRKGLTDFACKPVGIVEYTKFAEAVDPRITTRCLQCPPDCTEGRGYVCVWEFTISGSVVPS